MNKKEMVMIRKFRKKLNSKELKELNRVLDLLKEPNKSPTIQLWKYVKRMIKKHNLPSSQMIGILELVKDAIMKGV